MLSMVGRELIGVSRHQRSSATNMFVSSRGTQYWLSTSEHHCNASLQCYSMYNCIANIALYALHRTEMI